MAQGGAASSLSPPSISKPLLFLLGKERERGGRGGGGGGGGGGQRGRVSEPQSSIEPTGGSGLPQHHRRCPRQIHSRSTVASLPCKQTAAPRSGPSNLRRPSDERGRVTWQLCLRRVARRRRHQQQQRRMATGKSKRGGRGERGSTCTVPKHEQKKRYLDMGFFLSLVSEATCRSSTGRTTATTRRRASLDLRPPSQGAEGEERTPAPSPPSSLQWLLAPRVI